MRYFTLRTHSHRAFAVVLLVECLLIKYATAKFSDNEVTPRNIEIAIGGNANITCSIHSSQGGNSKSLYFIEDVENNAGKRVPKKDIAIIDPYTIVYNIRNASEQDRKYKCMLSPNSAIGTTHVSVGTPPHDIKDFRCRGYDYTYFVCNFTKPVNMVPVHYNVTYTAQAPFTKLYRHKNGTRFYRTIYSQNYRQICHLKMEKNYGICNLTRYGGNVYRHNYEFFNFSVVGYNVLGINRQHFWINNFESVIPPRIEFRILNLTTDSVRVMWYLDNYGYYAEKGLHYEVLLRPDNFDWISQTNYEILSNNSSFELILKTLPYAYYWYTMRIRARVLSSHNENTEYSEPYEERFQTLSMLPEFAPATDVGSFYIGSSDPVVRLYWTQLPKYQENGPNFQYVIDTVMDNGTKVDLKPLKIDRISAKFPWNATREYDFAVRSKNDVGVSLAVSKIFVPTMTFNYEEFSPKWIRNVHHELNHSNTLSWTPPHNQQDLLHYTVFWCPKKGADTNECQGSIEFLNLDKNHTSFNTNVQKGQQTLNFAVSANYAHKNTGMHWAMCAVEDTSDLIKLEPEYTPDNCAIVVEWNVDRICRSIIEGYNLTYCVVETLTDTNAYNDNVPCLTQNATVIIDKEVNKFKLNKLKPYTTYKLQMNMYSMIKDGPISDAQYITTKEEAPEAPSDLQYFNLTNNSVWISWRPPTEFNGRLNSYNIFYNDKLLKVECGKNESNVCHNNKEIKYKLENLSSYTTYIVNVSATTVANSPPSNNIFFKTLIGVPSNPQGVTTGNNNKVIKWKEPAVPAGRLEFYEVNFTVWHGNSIKRQYISSVIGAMSCTINLPKCLDSNYEHTIQVRAVNAVLRDNETVLIETNTNSYIENENDNELRCTSNKLTQSEQENYLNRLRNTEKYVLLKSDWEKGPFYACAPATRDYLFIWILIALTVAFVIGLLHYWGVKKLRDMWNIKCTLPEGLCSPESYNYENEKLYQRNETLKQKSNYSPLISSDNNGNEKNLTTSSVSIGRSSGYESSQHMENCNMTEKPAITDDAYIVMRKPSEIDNTKINNIAVPESNYVNPTAAGIHPTSNYINKWNGWQTEFQTPNTVNAPSICTVDGYTTVDVIGCIGTPSLISPTTAIGVKFATSPKHMVDVPHDKCLPPSGYITRCGNAAYEYQQTAYGNS